MFPIAEDSDRGDASPKSGLPSSAAPMASDSTRCTELLKSGDYNVTEAATMTGFNDLGHFREVFNLPHSLLLGWPDRWGVSLSSPSRHCDIAHSLCRHSGIRNPSHQNHPPREC